MIDPRVIEPGWRAACGRNVKAIFEADVGFHTAIYAASGNPLIEQGAQLHRVRLRRVMGVMLQASPQREAILDEHAANGTASPPATRNARRRSSNTTAARRATTCSRGFPMS